MLPDMTCGSASFVIILLIVPVGVSIRLFGCVCYSTFVASQNVDVSPRPHVPNSDHTLNVKINMRRIRGTACWLTSRPPVQSTSTVGCKAIL